MMADQSISKPKIQEQNQKRCHYHHLNNEQHTGHTFISQIPARWKQSYGITAGFSS
jgi:hypothetical protein